MLLRLEITDHLAEGVVRECRGVRERVHRTDRRPTQETTTACAEAVGGRPTRRA
jgi:hypothetical protein